jgi:hypothetical protein
LENLLILRESEEERERGWDEQREGMKGKERCIRVEKWVG